MVYMNETEIENKIIDAVKEFADETIENYYDGKNQDGNGLAEFDAYCAAIRKMAWDVLPVDGQKIQDATMREFNRVYKEQKLKELATKIFDIIDAKKDRNQNIAAIMKLI